MSDLPWLVTLASTLAWSAFDAVRKKLVEKIDVAALSLWLSLAQVPGYFVWAIFEDKWTIGPDYWRPALASIALNLVSNLAFFEAMRIAPFSITIPMLSFTPVFVAILGGPLLGEDLVAQQWAGICLVTAGALVLSTSRGEGPIASRLLRSFFGERGVRLMLWVSLFWALAPLADKVALRSAGIGVHGLVLSAGVAGGMALYLAARGRLGAASLPPRESLGFLALGGGINVVALGLQFIAISGAVVSSFEAFKRALGLMLAIASGRLFFGEAITRRKVGAGLVMAAGVVLVLVRFF